MSETKRSFTLERLQKFVEKIISKITVKDVQVNGTTVVDQNGTANVPMATNNSLGVVMGSENGGVVINNTTGKLNIVSAYTGVIKSGITSSLPITTGHTHTSAFYGLAKAAGDTTQSQSNNAVGTYTSEAKAAIQTMLGIETGIEVVRLI